MEKQIALRKSIRHYTHDALAEAAQTALASWRDWAERYTDSADADCDLHLLPGDAPLKGLYIVKAPGYIVFLGRPTRMGRINAGFVLEQISLKLTELGVGTCYLGAAHMDDLDAEKNDLEPLIFMSLGTPDQTLTRQSVSEFKRKRTDEIAVGEIQGDMARVIESARLAPSAMNRQPWRIALDGNRAICCVEHSVLDAFKRLSEIDMGIVMSHMLLTARASSEKAHIEFTPQDADKAPRGSEYIATVVIS